MKKVIFSFLGIALVLAMAGVAEAGVVIPNSDKAREHGKAPDHSPVISLDSSGDGWTLEVIEFIHYAKPENPGQGKGKKKPEGESCYGFISGQAKLLTKEDLYINPANSGMDNNDVYKVIVDSAQTWDEETGANIFGSIDLEDSADFDHPYSPDGDNEVSFGDYPQDGVIGVTRIWGKFSGKPNTRYISQFDILFDTNFEWGDASGDSSLMDFQNIATHELGHALGLDDMYAEACAEVTMYGYSEKGETIKRSLEPQDIAGLEELYGA